MGGTHRSERREQIVDAALQIIATRGSRRFTAHLLASEVGLTAGALYRHFPGMDAVVDAVVDRVGAILFDGFPPVAADPVERLRLFFQRRARAIVAQPHLARLLLSDHLAQAGGAAQAKRLAEFRRRSQEYVHGCLHEARKRGLLAPGIATGAGVIVVTGSILALSRSASVAAGDAGSERLIAEVWAGIERMLRGVGAPPRPRPTRRPRGTRRRGAAPPSTRRDRT